MTHNGNGNGNGHKPDADLDLVEIRNMKEYENKEAFFEKVTRDIELMSFSAIGIMADLPFTYTVGLRDSFDHPELLIYSMPPPQANSIFFSAVDRIKDGHPFKAGQRRSDVIVHALGGELFVLIHEIPEPGHPLNMARAYHKRDESALQIVWPDYNGKFPNEEGYDHDLTQPLLDGQEEEEE